ncbi:MAG: pantetheine-phosphate adenylyltransferase [Treponema sp.]|jgi:pantetheine-phosphate adenylyltransferase|nr:pantetheine-phosphate adenylyltransferase [Treponema sp.]
MLRAVFPGSFDPPTLGHLNIIERAGSLFEELIVVVAENRNKRALFSADERTAMMRELARPWSNVSVSRCDYLIVEFMQKTGCRILIRGVRGVDDFSYEFEVAMINKALRPPIETLFMPTDPQYFVLRSSSIKELASFQADVSGMVPPLVAKALSARYSGGP